MIEQISKYIEDNRSLCLRRYYKNMGGKKKHGRGETRKNLEVLDWGFKPQCELRGFLMYIFR